MSAAPMNIDLTDSGGEGGEIMNGVAQTLCRLVTTYLIGLSFFTFVFMFRRKKTARVIDRRLTFFSPDELPRDFKQHGFEKSFFGTCLLNGWVGYFALGYISMIVGSVLFYAKVNEDDDGIAWIPAWPKTFLGGSDSMIRPWLLVYTTVHILGMFLTLLWPALQTSFMVPVALMSEASHIMIEENVPFQTDDDLVDPDIFELTTHHTRRMIHRVKTAVARTVLPIQTDDHGTRHVEYTCVRYVYSYDTDRFHPEKTKKYTPTEVHGAYKAGGLSTPEVQKVLITSGRNEINVSVPGIFASLGAEFADFTYVFNSVGTWAYIILSSANIGVFWLLLSVVSGTIRSIGVVRPNLKKIQSLARLQASCLLLRDGKWVRSCASELVPGDIVGIDDGDVPLPCDGIVVSGSLVVNESMLTGEPMPIHKLPAEDSTRAVLSKKNMAYAGTLCLQSSGPQDGKAVMLVTAVGALTTRGQLVRSVLFPASVRFKYNDQLPIVYIMMGFYVCIVACIMIRTAPISDWPTLYLTLIALSAQCLNPMLPVSMVMGQSVTALRLQNVQKIGVLQPGRIPIAGKISVMVFDKTGTITKDGMDFSGVLPAAPPDGGAAKFAEEVSLRDVKSVAAVIESKLPSELRLGLACCHTVTTLRNGTFVGNQVEVAMVQAVGWKVGEDTITAPSGGESLEVIKRLEFDHCRMTSGVVARRRSDGHLAIYLKGSYEIIKGKCVPESVPADYDAATEARAKAGYYVLAMATKELPKESTTQQIADLTRDQLESGLHICGLLLFRNEMKSDSPLAIEKLRQSRIRSVICTGDNALTGISIGRQCSICCGPALLGDLHKEGKMLEWRNPDSESAAVCDPFAPEYSSYELAVTQGAWRYLHANLDELETLWRRLTVFARMKPDDKINVVKYYQSQDHVVGMCGDGGNDCGSLRAAHAGLALSDAEASMVSPFSTSRDDKSLLTVVDLIREGRACLSTNLGTFQYFMVYALLVSTMKTWVSVMGPYMFSEYSWLAMDIIISMCMVWSMTQSEAKPILFDYRPTATLLGPQTMLGIIFPYVTAVLTAGIGFILIGRQPWYIGLNPIEDMHLLPMDWTRRADQYVPAVSTLILICALATTAYVSTYGGDFRRNIMSNIGLNVLYGVMMFGIFWILLMPTSSFSCVFRINCDTKTSLEAGVYTWLAAFSSNDLLGGCFYGPQIAEFQKVIKNMPKFSRGWWKPSRQLQCLPPEGSGISLDSEFWIPGYEEVGCYGPNNCFSDSYKWQLATLIVIFVVANHLFVKLVLQGPLATTIRLSRRRAKDSAQQQRDIELADRRATGGSDDGPGGAGGRGGAGGK